MTTFQHTIQKETSIRGVGLHTGMPVKMTFKPASPNHGIRFKRIDLEKQPVIKADANLVTDIQRGTTLERNGTKVSTIEHALAALMGLEIDNVLIELDSQEVPIMDGSAQPFVDVLLEAGIEKQDAEKKYFTITENIYYRDEEKDVEMMILPSEEYQVTVMIDFNSPVLGKQHATLSQLQDFKEEIASSRTFCFLHELEFLLKNNLIKGGDLSNAIVVVDKEVNEEELTHLATLFKQPKVEVRQEGYLNNVELRHKNEPARHKLLDVIGDLALIGTPLKGRVIASKPGHASNIAFAKKIKQYIKEHRHLVGAPVYDPNQTPLYNIEQIKELLPHRSPFLLIDKIMELTKTTVVGIKSVTYNEPFFRGHFPHQAVMPGVLILEAMAQTGGILVLNQVPDPENYITYFLKIQEAKFRNMVVPGDTLIFKMELLSPIRRGICEMQATAYVGKKIAAEARLTAQVRKHTH